MKERPITRDYGTKFYEEVRQGQHTPLSNSAVICYMKEQMKVTDIGTSQFYASAAFLLEELNTADEREIALRNEIEELNAQLESARKALSGYIHCANSYKNDVERVESMLQRRSDFENKDVWYWMSGGGNHIQSMSNGMTVLISGADLKRIVPQERWGE